VRNQIEFEFDDLAIVTDAAGFECGSLTGRATIDFANAQDWHVQDISLTGSRRASAAEVARSGVFVRKEVAITPDEHGFLYFTIKEQIEASCKNAIEEKIVEAIDEMSEPVGSAHLREYA
jgi:hypothetical protein